MLDENIFDKRRLKTYSNCKELVKSMVGTRDGVIFYNEKFILDLENTCYKASICEDLSKENQQLKHILDELEKWLEEENKKTFIDIVSISVYQKVLDKTKELRGRENE